MANIVISDLPVATTPDATDVLILNVGNQTTSQITFNNFKANLNVFTNPGRFPDGTAVSPGISFANGTDTGIFRISSGNELAFTTNGSQRGQFTGTGDFGVNYPTPTHRLTVGGNARFEVAAGASVRVDENGGSVPMVGSGEVNPFALGINNSEAARFDVDGNFLVGTSVSDGNNKLVVDGSTSIQDAIISNGGATNNLNLSSGGVTFMNYNAAGAAGFGGANYGAANDVLLSAGTAAPPTWVNQYTSVNFLDFRSFGDLP